MLSFVQRFGAKIIGMLRGFDRLRFRGTRRELAYAEGMMGHLWKVQVPLTKFKDYVLERTRMLREATEALAQKEQRPIKYLESSSTNKEEEALAIAKRDGVKSGLVCVLSCVEPCWSYDLHKNREAKRLELRGGVQKCLHYYHYRIDPKVGWCHTRLQTWFPFTAHVYINGREWLSRELDRAGIGYRRYDNCFLDIDDLARAQALMDKQLETDWPALRNGFVRRANPVEGRLLGACPVPYYWSLDQSEWATDAMFRRREELQELYPLLLRHGIEHLGSHQVLRFLGKKWSVSGEVTTRLKERPEGFCLTHAVGRNSLKMYDKYSVLRFETTLNRPKDIKVYRAKEGDEEGAKANRPMRKGVADLHRRAEVCEAANVRHMDSLAAAVATTPLKDLVDPLCRPTRWQGKRVRALQPLAGDDCRLLEAVAQGKFLLTGFRNRDLQALLYPSAATDKPEARRRTGSISRKIQLLRAHGLVRKMPNQHLYKVTDKGRQLIAAVIAARSADTAKLTNAA